MRGVIIVLMAILGVIFPKFLVKAIKALIEMMLMEVFWVHKSLLEC